MENYILNKKIVEYIPKLRSKYDEEVSWQEGDCTGSHTVFGDVLTPYLIECILQNHNDEVVLVFKFLEEILSLNDDYAEEVVSLSVFESIAYVFEEKSYLIDYLGERSKKILKEVSK